MLKYKQGDLIAAAIGKEVTVIAHQCNCFNNMGAGIAPQIAKAFPSAERADNATIRGDKGKLGTLTHGYDERYDLFVFNLYGQYRYGRGMHTDYAALRLSLREMATWLDKDDFVGLPKIGCGHGGGDWRIVSKIIEEELGKFDVTIYEL